MSYPDHEYYITFLFERLEDFKASVDAPQPQTYGRPKSYADENLIVLLAILTLKGIYSFKAQHRWLKTHPQWLCHFKLEKVPLEPRYPGGTNNWQTWRRWLSILVMWVCL